jgi:HEPN domain-containing protein
MKQTAVEWLENELKKIPFINPKEAFEQAKAMEKEQIKDAFVECWKSNVPDGIECKLDAEQYYKETFIT